MEFTFEAEKEQYLSLIHIYGEEVVLKPMEFECLMMFVKYKNIALSREQILKGLWGVEFEGETRTVDVHVAQLRKKLDFGDVIKTIPKVGYLSLIHIFR